MSLTRQLPRYPAGGFARRAATAATSKIVTIVLLAVLAR